MCLCVSSRAYLWNCCTDLHEIWFADPGGRGSVFLWWHCDTSCTSGFMNDVTFGRSGPYGETWRLHRAAAATSGLAIPGRNLVSVNALFLLILPQNTLADVARCHAIGYSDCGRRKVLATPDF